MIRMLLLTVTLLLISCSEETTETVSDVDKGTYFSWLENATCLQGSAMLEWENSSYDDTLIGKNGIVDTTIFTKEMSYYMIETSNGNPIGNFKAVSVTYSSSIPLSIVLSTEYFSEIHMTPILLPASENYHTITIDKSEFGLAYSSDNLPMSDMTVISFNNEGLYHISEDEKVIVRISSIDLLQ